MTAYCLSSESLGYRISTNQIDYIFKAVVKVTYSILKNGSFSPLRNRRFLKMTDPSITVQYGYAFKAKKHLYLA